MRFTRALITPPTEAVLSLAEIKAHVRVEHSDDDALLVLYLNAAVALIDPAAGGWLGRALRPQTWEYRLDGFPCWSIELPYPPLINVISVKYDDVNGVEQTLIESTHFRVLGKGAPLARQSIEPLWGGAWPVARCQAESVRIRYQCGYPLAPSDAIPAVIRQWLLLKIGAFYANREQFAIGGAMAVSLPDHVEQMINSVRVY
jgi:uncharacterized phiE125 gp8 family phage protein